MLLVGISFHDWLSICLWASVYFIGIILNQVLLRVEKYFSNSLAYGVYRLSYALASQRKDSKVGNKAATPARHSSHGGGENNMLMPFQDSIIQLQRTVGNQAVQRLLHFNGRNEAVRTRIQPKLKISRPGDEYEQEVKRVAEKIVSMTNDNPISSTMSHKVEKIDCKCATCEMKEKEKKEEKLRISRKPSNTYILEESDEIPNEINNIRSDSGIPLDRGTREFMESRFGHDFSKVRIHADEKAARSAQSVNALAYTVGNDIIFEGQHLPESESGRKLLAHELTHVVQQRNGDLRIARAPEDEADAGVPEAKPVPSATTPAPGSTPPVPVTTPSGSTPPVPDMPVTPAPKSTTPPVPLTPAPAVPATHGGHTVAPPGVVSCPDAPELKPFPDSCDLTPSATPPAKETAADLLPSPSHFDGDKDLDDFAFNLAVCRAARWAPIGIGKRYKAAVETARKDVEGKMKKKKE